MAITMPIAARTGTRMTAERKIALTAGILYVITFISIPTLALYSHLKTDPDFVLGSGSDAGVLWGGLLEVIVALAGIGTAVTLYPVVKRWHHGAALGFVAVRVVEAAMIFTGVVSILTLVSLRHNPDAATALNRASLVTTAAAQVATYKATFLLGQTLMPCLSALLLGSLMYKSRLVPRAIPLMGLIGSPFLIVATLATLLGHNHPTSLWSALATIPVAAWELSLGVWMITKGFTPSAVAPTNAAPTNAAPTNAAPTNAAPTNPTAEPTPEPTPWQLSAV